MGDIIFPDYYSEALAEIITNQQTEIELLTEQRDTMVEQINGLTYIINYQHIFLGVSLILIAVVILHNVLSKWFFRGC